MSNRTLPSVLIKVAQPYIFLFYLGVFLKSLSNEAFDNSPRPEIEDFIKLGDSFQL